MPRLVVMDALGLAYRSYYALARWGTNEKGEKHRYPALSNSRKEPTNAIYGMANLFMKFRRELKPDRWALAWDGPGPTFRHELYPQYKEHRPEMPEELAAQLTPIEDLARCMGLPVIEKPGMEADDVMATLSRVGAEAGYEVVLVTGDKDMLQLVGESVFVLAPQGKGDEYARLDAESVRAKWGVPPEQIRDVLALMGDASDGYPGVPGVGEKTAVELLTTFGSVDAMYERLAEIKKPALAKKLAENKALAYVSRELATVRRDLDLGFALDDLAVAPIRRDELLAFAKRWEVRRLEQVANEVGVADEQAGAPVPQRPADRRGTAAEQSSRGRERASGATTATVEAPDRAGPVRRRHDRPARDRAAGLARRRPGRPVREHGGRGRRRRRREPRRAGRERARGARARAPRARGAADRRRRIAAAGEARGRGVRGAQWPPLLRAARARGGTERERGPAPRLVRPHPHRSRGREGWHTTGSARCTSWPPARSASRTRTSTCAWARSCAIRSAITRSWRSPATCWAWGWTRSSRPSCAAVRRPGLRRTRRGRGRRARRAARRRTAAAGRGAARAARGARAVEALHAARAPVDRRARGHGARRDRAGSGVLTSMSAAMAAEIAALETKLHALAGEPVNLASGPQLGKLLFEKLKLPTAQDENRLVHGLRGAGSARAAARVPAAAARVARAHQAQVHVRGRAARGDGPRATGACTPRSTRPARPPAGSPRWIPTSRTSPFARRRAARSAGAFVAAPAACWWAPTTRRSSCACSAHLSGDPNLVEAFRAARTSTPRRRAASSRSTGDVPPGAARARQDRELRRALRHGAQGAWRKQMGLELKDGEGVHRRLLHRLRRACVASSTRRSRKHGAAAGWPRC
jgi:5'-3' exonuclease